ncbi:DUF423 domain-containing protein [uncultured Eudoraea sp.]|uniref:DUF423 domain-containing protein n=1 Tax=uncultured Eudoraea sp. TaxID=1035614 RepID=UPI0026397E0B|nr:DUF423 domain-containing protein [uncultured Eudoraea sp.]
MNKTIFCTGIFFGALSVVLGAFGAHGLKNVMSLSELDTFNTGVTYQMYHALLLLVLGSVQGIPEKAKKQVYYLIVSGIIFFSFSIYLLATNSLTGFNFKTIGFITPIGGVLMILGWLLLGYQAYRRLK